MATIRLLTGASMPALGFGTWMAPKGQVGAAVKIALQCGYKHIDCAQRYENEDEIGAVFEEAFKNGIVKREDVFITSKLWVTDMARENVVAACTLSLKNLKLNNLDLYLIHTPAEQEYGTKKLMGYNADRTYQTWQGMEECVDNGLTKAIGISNFSTKKVADLLSRDLKHKPVCNQVENHPYLPQKKLNEYCSSQGLITVAYSPLGNPGRPSGINRATDPKLFDDPVIQKLAAKYNCSLANILVAWNIAHGRGVLVKSVSESRIRENLLAKDVRLEAADVAEIDAISTRHRYLDFSWLCFEGQPPEDFFDGEFIN